jgi:ATP-binding cassette subfamily B protein
MSFYHRTRLGTLISRFTSDVESVRTGLQQVAFVSIVQGGQMLITGIFLFYYDAVLFCVVLSITPGFWLVNRCMRRELSTVLRELQESFSRVTASLAEAVNGIRVTQGYGREEENAALFSELIEDHARYNLRASRARALYGPLLELNSQLFLAVLVVFGGWRVLRPEAPMQLQDFIQFFFLTNLFFAPIQVLSNQYQEALTAMAGAERLFRLLDQAPHWEDRPDAEDIPRIRGEVEFRDVRFAYEPGKPVLHGISFRCEPGQTVALVGHTGSGKSSIINLLAKFYLPDSGEIRIDGRELGSLRADSLHRQLGLVLQTNFLFSGTVLENIRFTKPGATEAEVTAAARRLEVLDLIERLGEGLHTQVGERGGSLAAGERQVVCFVRALLADPRILILDEATSSIDAITEARLQGALAKLLQGRTSFVIAHRLSTIRQADQVLVLDQGRIVEHGSHRELLALGGRYAALHRSFTRMETEDGEP